MAELIPGLSIRASDFVLDLRSVGGDVWSWPEVNTTMPLAIENLVDALEHWDAWWWDERSDDSPWQLTLEFKPMSAAVAIDRGWILSRVFNDLIDWYIVPGNDGDPLTVRVIGGQEAS